METAVAVKDQSAVPAELIDGKKIKEYLDVFGLSKQLSENETVQFIEVAKAFNLNPFKKEIYCVPYGQGDKRKLSIITGYEVYLKRAERIGMLAGWRSWTEGTFEVRYEKKELQGRNGPYTKNVKVVTGDMRAIVEIHRTNWPEPFRHEVYLDEYALDNEMWAAKPRTMLKKVAIAQAFRMVFPDEMGGMPYTSDELPDEMTRNVTEESETHVVPPAEPPQSKHKMEADQKAAAVAKDALRTNTEKNPFKLDMVALRDELGAIMTAKDEAGAPYFDDDDKAKVKNLLMDLKYDEESRDFLRGIVDHWKKDLEKKKAIDVGAEESGAWNEPELTIF